VISSDRSGDRAKCWTFGGLKDNASIAAMFMSKEGCSPRFNNYFVEMPDTSDTLEADKLLRKFGRSKSGESCATADPPARVKFWECLPDALQARS
jgi:hypothetical protein